MTTRTARAYWRFGIPRRRRAVGKAREVRIEPTKQTLAKLKLPPWQDWPSELKHAALAIDCAVRLLAGRSLCQAQDLGHVARKGVHWEDDSPQDRIIRRYQGWAACMERLRWPVQPVLEAVVQGHEPADPWLLRRALHLHATGQVLSGLGRSAKENT